MIQAALTAPPPLPPRCLTPTLVGPACLWPSAWLMCTCCACSHRTERCGGCPDCAGTLRPGGRPAGGFQTAAEPARAGGCSGPAWIGDITAVPEAPEGGPWSSLALLWAPSLHATCHSHHPSHMALVVMGELIVYLLRANEAGSTKRLRWVWGSSRP